MNNNKGITLISLMIYVIGMTIILGIIATITSFFYNNVNIEDLNEDTTTQYTKFSSIFLEEINTENNKVIECKTLVENDEQINYIIFSSGNQYTFNSKSKSIYKNKIKICKNIDNCEFSYTFGDSKYKIKVKFKAKNIDNEIEYILK